MKPGPLIHALALVAPLLVGCGGGGEVETFERVEVLHDLSLEPDRWELVETIEGAPPRASVITPAVNIETDSADKPSIVLAPGSRLRFVVPEAEGELWLRASAGVDQRTRNKVPREVGRIVVGFEVKLDGAVAFDREIVVERPKRGEWDPTPWIWHHLGLGEGVRVEPGSTVELSTRWVEPLSVAQSGLPVEEVLSGFGGVFIERRTLTERTRPTPDAPNLVLVVMDTLRADRLSCYGYEVPTSPNLDAVAERGVRFEQAFATSSWTWPATASIFTGLTPEAHGVTSNSSCTLSQQSRTLAEALQSRGFTTAAFVANPLIGPERYFDQGFESFSHSTLGGCRTSDEIIPPALEWLDANHARRFFLYLHMTDPHTPHLPHPEEVARLGGAPRPDSWPERGLNAVPHDPSLPMGGVDEPTLAYASALYDASVATGDRWFGEVLARLEEHGLTDRTVIAFTADHGEELWERGFVGHGHGLHGELVRVPLVLAGPGIEGGEVVSRIVSNRHLAPTLALLGAAELDPMGTGELLVGDGAAPEAGEAGFSTFRARWDGLTRDLFGLRRGRWLIHWTGEGRVPGKDVRLFDLEADPSARQDRAAEETEIAGELLDLFAARLERERALRPAVVLGAGGGGLEALYELGYIDRAEDEDE